MTGDRPVPRLLYGMRSAGPQEGAALGVCLLKDEQCATLIPWSYGAMASVLGLRAQFFCDRDRLPNSKLG